MILEINLCESIWTFSFPKNNSKKLSEKVSGKYSPGMLAARENLLDHAKKSVTDAIKSTSEKVIQKTTEATGDLIGNKIANKFTKNLPQNNSETSSQTEVK